MNKPLNMSSQGNAIRANVILECITRGILSRREVILPLCTALVRPILEYCVHFQCPHFEKDVEKLEKAQKRAIKIVRGLEKMPYSERPKGLSRSKRPQRTRRKYRVHRGSLIQRQEA